MFIIEIYSGYFKMELNHINNINCLFYECSSIKSISDISKWKTNNITDIIYLFYVCSSLESIPDISK